MDNISKETVKKTKSRFSFKFLTLMAVIGPGIVVMLADTDAGSIITAAQSGAVWGYRLLLLQFILIPILYIAQELTVRLGLVTGCGHGELIKQQFGKYWAWISVSTLMICCVGAIITEFSGLVGVGALFGVSAPIVMTLVITFLIVITLTGSYHSVERIALIMGLFELVFIVVAFMAHPSMHEIADHIMHIPIHNSNYLYLSAANIGAVIMPWMIFYQQSAVVDKKLTVQHLKIARWDTAIGAVITQLIMAAVLIITAATIGNHSPNTSLNTVQQISHALIPYLGSDAGKIIFGLGMIGASMVAAIVVSLTAAWGLGEITGYKRSLEHHPKEAPWFYLTYIFVLILGGILVTSHINLVKLSVGVEVMNALVLPIVLGFLFLLSIKALPEKYKLKGWYAWAVGLILLVTTLFGVYAGISGIV